MRSFQCMLVNVKCDCRMRSVKDKVQRNRPTGIISGQGEKERHPKI